jgi:hypothetical protein
MGSLWVGRGDRGAERGGRRMGSGIGDVWSVGRFRDLESVW